MRTISICMLVAAAVAGCRDHTGLDRERLGDSDMLAGRIVEFGGTDVHDTDLLLGYIHARSSYLVPLRTLLRDQLRLRGSLFGNLEVSIPAGTTSTYDPTTASGTERGTRRTTTTVSATPVTLAMSTLSNEYRRLCSVEHLGRLFPHLRSGDFRCSPFGDEESLRYWIDDLVISLDHANIDVGWVPPDTAIGENPRNPVLEIVLPVVLDADPNEEHLPLDVGDHSADFAVRLQVVVATEQRVRFEAYRHPTSSIGDLSFSDAGVELGIRVTHRNVRGEYAGTFEPTLDVIDGMLSKLLGRSFTVATLDGATASERTWQDWCRDSFITCPIPDDVLARLAARSYIQHDRTLVDLADRSGDPLPEPRAFVGADDRWTNTTIHALAEGAFVTSATFERDGLAGLCRSTTRCTEPGRDLDCVVCDFCASPPVGTAAVCDLQNAFTMPAGPTGRISAMTISGAPTLARFVDLAPNLGLELTRIFTRPLDRFRAARGDLAYVDAVYCVSGTPAGCPLGRTGAIFFLATDPDGDGVGFLDNCPYVANPGQEDGDGDGRGDACDACPHVFRGSSADTDGDGTPDGCDCDLDSDGCNNSGSDRDGQECSSNGEAGLFDQNPRIPAADLRDGAWYNTDGSLPGGDEFMDDCDRDDDADGVLDEDDNCHFIPNPHQEDADHNGVGDVCDSLCPGRGCNAIEIHEVPERISFGGWVPGLDEAIDCLADGRGCMIYWLVEQGDLVARGGLAYEPRYRVSAKDHGIAGFVAGTATRIADLDGDGHDDLAVAATSPCDPDCGGDTAGRVLGIGSLSGKVLFELEPLAADAGFGAALTRVGTELWIGAPRQTDATGNPTGAVLRYRLVNNEPILTGVLFGETEQEHFGASLTTVTRDGIRRVIVGAPNAGRFDVLDEDGLLVGRVEGPGKGEGDGSRAVGVDKSFDGDLLLAWPDARDGRGLVELRSFEGKTIWQVVGGLGDRLGSGIAAPVDLDGDGIARALVGAPGFYGKGAVLVLDSSGKLETLVTGDGGEFGANVVSPGDLDDDGHADFTVAMPGFVPKDGPPGALLHFRGTKSGK
jgi:hypothetical protein